MKIYVVSVLDEDVYDFDSCPVCWKMVRAFVREDDAKEYVKAQQYPNDYDIEDIELTGGFE